MTKATDAALAFITATAIYVAFYFGAIPTPAIVYEQIIPVLPWWALVSYGCYTLGSLGYGVFTLEDKPDKYEELLTQIIEAKQYLAENNVIEAASN